ncbi:hypothetical protein Q9L58_001474 [Maublancomyces gigas]|uniref:Uncharacterized protein n=1 Tax=Discina gigas TaxID=1032678 RepID=A0ABR3GV39_9PEZI
MYLSNLEDPDYLRSGISRCPFLNTVHRLVPFLRLGTGKPIIPRECPITGVQKPTDGPHILEGETETDLDPDTDTDISWDLLCFLVTSPPWTVLTSSCPFVRQYGVLIEEEYHLKHIPETSYIRSYTSDITIARCEDGVYGFGLDFDFGFLVARTNKCALEWIRNPSAPTIGPTRRAGDAYDAEAEDVFKGPYEWDSGN